MGRTACTEPQCLYSRAIPLLTQWAVRPVQSLSACTLELHLYSLYGPYDLYRASVPVQGCALFMVRKLLKLHSGCCFLDLAECADLFHTLYPLHFSTNKISEVLMWGPKTVPIYAAI
jgi:hypothetical protein